jgi:hypothetical protein
MGGWDVAWGGSRGPPWPAAVPWKRTSERVRIPSLAGLAGVPLEGFYESSCLGLQLYQVGPSIFSSIQARDR